MPTMTQHDMALSRTRSFRETTAATVGICAATGGGLGGAGGGGGRGILLIKFRCRTLQRVT